MRKLTIILAALVSTLLSCTEQPEVIPFTYTDIFTGGSSKSWRIRSIQLLQTGKGTQTLGVDPCIGDDIYTFHNTPEHKFVVSEGSTKCSDSDPEIVVDDSWSFVNSNATMTIPFPLLGGTVPFIVKEASDSRMTLEIYFSDDQGSYRFNFISTSGG